MSEHSRLQPSSAHRWVPCPGSVPLEAQYPEEDGLEAQEGHAAHWLAAEMIQRGPGGAPVLVEVAPNGVPITEEMRDLVPVYVSDVLATKAKFGTRAVNQIEHRIHATSVHPDNWGTADDVLYCNDTARIVIWDFKWGHGFVEVFENWQLLNYLAGVLDQLEHSGHADYEVTLRIVQPRSYHREGPIREWSFKASAARDYIRQLNASANEALGNDPSTVPGPHCKRCNARHACKANQAVALDVVDSSSDSTPHDLPPSALGRELSVLTRAREMLESRITGLQAQAEAEIRKGTQVPGWAIEHTVGREAWSVTAEEVATLGDMLGVKLSKGPEVVTPAQARKAGVDETIIAQYSSRKPGSSKLASVSIVSSRKAFGG